MMSITMIFSTRSDLPIEMDHDLRRSQPPPIVAVEADDDADTFPNASNFRAPTDSSTMLA